MVNLKDGESSTLYQFISTAFCVIVIISNVISAKMIPMPYFGNFCIPVGLLTYPVTFLLSDLVTEIFGAKQAKRMVYITLGMNILTLGILQMALNVPGQSIEEHNAFQAVFGLSGWRIFSSLVAYSVVQVADIQIYAMIKRWTGPRFLWVRANGSTWASQLIDTVLIDLLFLYWGVGMSLFEVAPIMLFSVVYKILFSVAMTPFFYLLVLLIRGEQTFAKDLFTRKERKAMPETAFIVLPKKDRK